MEDQKVILSTAKLAKKVGFEIGVRGIYTEYLKTQKSDNPSFQMTKGEVEFDNSAYIINNSLGDLSNKSYTSYAAPTQSLLQKWLRDVKKLHIQVEHCNKPLMDKWIFELSRIPTGMIYMWDKDKSTQYDTYEDALEAGLQYTLIHLINDKT